MGARQSAQRPETDVPAFKIVLVGAPRSGKSSVFLRYIKNQHQPYYNATRKPVIENVVRKLNVPGHAIVSLTLWDLPGRDDLDLRSTYFRNVDAAIVVVDMGDEQSVEMAGVWRREVLNHATRTRPPGTHTRKGLVEAGAEEHCPVAPEEVPVLLLGNKYDVIEKQTLMELQGDSTDNPSSDDLTEVDQQATEGELEQVLSLNPSFPAQQGLEPGEEKPAAVHLLEKVCDENHFTASVMVSCRDNDGSVEGALQTLVRHLVTKRYPDSVEKWKHPTVTKPKLLDKTSHLEMVGVTQLDELFRKCSVIISHVTDLCQLQHEAFVRFREACYRLGVLDSRKGSLEECIEGLRDAFPEEHPLKIVEKEGFYHLEVHSTREINIRKDIKNVFDAFNSEFAEVSRVILLDFPKYVASLKGHDAEVTRLCERINSLDETLSDQMTSPRDQQWRVERNRALIEFTGQKAEAACVDTQTMSEKIALAMLW